jgi:uncharacterized protein (DUF305 family)
MTFERNHRKTVAVAIVAAFTLAAVPGPGTLDGAMSSAMQTMNAGMSTAAMTGNPDEDFMRMMIPHHQGAIDMAQIELRYGTDVRVKRLAEEIVVTQQAEIDLMRSYLATPKSR